MYLNLSLCIVFAICLSFLKIDLILAKPVSRQHQSLGEPQLYMKYQVQEDYVPIFGYHKILPEMDTPSTTTLTSLFQDQTQYLTQKAHCNWITMATLHQYILKDEKLPTNTCIMTFDDGIEDQFDNALCSLNKHEIPATFYIINNAIRDINENKNGYYMTFEEIKELDSIGHDIEPHTTTHAHLKCLTYKEQEEEILDSIGELKKLGYTSAGTSFAYPYGDDNEDTVDILRKHKILGRDTSQVHTWKNPRTITTGILDTYYYHFYYIKPEGLTGKELWEKAKWTGYWQFEDNYIIIRDVDNDIAVYQTEVTETSYGYVGLYHLNDEIYTQFKTKFEGAFTLDTFMHSEIPPEFVVDGKSYDSIRGDKEVKDPKSKAIFNNFYINIPNLSSGLHNFHVINKGDRRVMLDKFQLFSDTDQHFSGKKSHYKKCNPNKDKHCSNSCNDIVDHNNI